MSNIDNKANNKENHLDIEIELDESVSEGTYSNLAIINHSATEFIIDFINIMPAMPKAKVKSRVILTPHNIKRLSMALDKNLSKYESQFGEIKVEEEVLQGNMPITFGSTGEA
ncbi:DUF3467 domain-containing protein [Ichthyobacterium seriolicida]|uniref:Transcriptional accessory protein n=1 Tax=Ichthyobacterium seriolicida TaxID=242600 RepID=A0A1J1DW78_9FLAO|nr:DUF3467 domain-containing protein [Ichthyobacterium seriolicida]BAV94119.1 hypothetical protein JBKA6_0106 [Ichthyobacterium seriolicida]